MAVDQPLVGVDIPLVLVDTVADHMAVAGIVIDRTVAVVVGIVVDCTVAVVNSRVAHIGMDTAVMMGIVEKIAQVVYRLFEQVVLEWLG